MSPSTRAAQAAWQQRRFPQTFRKTQPGTGGHKGRPYGKTGSVPVGAAICRPAASGRFAARVDEGIDPYKVPPHPISTQRRPFRA